MCAHFYKMINKISKSTTTRRKASEMNDKTMCLSQSKYIYIDLEFDFVFFSSYFLLFLFQKYFVFFGFFFVNIPIVKTSRWISFFPLTRESFETLMKIDAVIILTVAYNNRIIINWNTFWWQNPNLFDWFLSKTKRTFSFCWFRTFPNGIDYTLLSL